MSPAAARTFAVIAGGGTAGHVSPGIAIAKALIARGHAADTIHYVGSARGIERQMVPVAGLPLTLLPGRGIKRTLSPRNVASAASILVAVQRAFRLLRRLEPRVVVALGGYASVPCAVAAKALRIPVVVAEQNAVPGLANRMVGRWAAACAVSFPGTDLPHAVLTGNPVRGDLREVDRGRDRPGARAQLDLDESRMLVTAYGGSLGARSINRAVAGSVPALAGSGGVVVRHIVGQRDWDTEVRPAGSEAYVPVRYEADMASVLLASDVVVCRAGASTIAELAVTATPSILVPLPGAPGDHQTANARAMVEAGGAVLVADADLTSDRLTAEVTALLADADRLAGMSAGAASLARRDAADAVAALAEEHARA